MEQRIPYSDFQHTNIYLDQSEFFFFQIRSNGARNPTAENIKWDFVFVLVLVALTDLRHFIGIGTQETYKSIRFDAILESCAGDAEAVSLFSIFKFAFVGVCALAEVTIE